MVVKEQMSVGEILEIGELYMDPVINLMSIRMDVTPEGAVLYCG